MYQDGRGGFTPDEVIEGSEVFILAQAPGADEEAQGKPKVGNVGQAEMRDYFPRAGLIRGQNVSLGNVLRCRWHGQNTMPPAEILKPALAQCTQYLYIPDSVRLIVAEGKHAWTFVGGPGGIKDWRGYLSPTLYAGRPTLGVVHVGDILQGEGWLRGPAKLDWTKIRRFLDGTWPAPIPPYEIWDGRCASLNQWYATVREAPYLVVDTEYHRETKDLHMIGLGAPGRAGLQIPYGTDFAGSMLRDFLLRCVQDHVIVFQNQMADVPVLEQNCGIRYEDYQRIEDTMLAHAVLWSELPHDLEFLASIYSSTPKQKHLRNDDPSRYNWGDVIDTDAVWQGVDKELTIDPLSRRVYEEQSLPLIPILLRTQAHGLRVNKERVKPAAALYAQRLEDARRVARDYLGRELNLGSPKQLAAYFYDEMKWPVQRHGRTRLPTVDVDAIATLRAKICPPYDPEEENRYGWSTEYLHQRITDGAHPVLEARVLYTKSLQTAAHYIRPCLKGNGQIRERVYPQFEIHAQASGRHSIVDPPLGQQPLDLRDLYYPDDGEGWLAWDWRQMEPRLLEALAGDGESLARPLDEDRYERWVPTIFPGATVDDPSWDARRKFTKRLILKMHYGGKPGNDIPGAKVLGLTPKQVAQAGNRYLASRPALVEWWARVADEARRTKLSRTFLGRRRVLLNQNAGAIKREAYNHPLQGGVADIFNLTLIAVAERFPQLRYVEGRHDSQTWAGPLDELADLLPAIRQIVERPWEVNGVEVRFPAKFEIRRG